jgi:hypothetical protein
MGWLLVVGVVWLVLAAAAAVLIGGAVRLADKKEKASAATCAWTDPPNFVVDLPTAAAAEPTADRHEVGVPAERERTTHWTG